MNCLSFTHIKRSDQNMQCLKGKILSKLLSWAVLLNLLSDLKSTQLKQAGITQSSEYIFIIYYEV